MLPDTFWKKEIAEDLQNRRALVMKFALPLVLLSPLMLAGVPVSVRAAGLAGAVIFIGVFGSSVGLIKIRENRMLERLAMLPAPPQRFIGEYIFANALLDGMQLAVPVGLFLAVSRSLAGSALVILVCFAAAVVAANALGLLVAIAAGSSGEGHLYAIVTVMAVFLVSGFVTPAGMTSIAAMGSVLPFGYLYGAMLDVGTVQGLLPVVIAPATALLLCGVALAVSPRLFRGL
jgi:hypothetical protein